MSKKVAESEKLSVVTGARGYVGYALVGELSKHEGKIRCLLRHDCKELEQYGVEKVFGDVTDSESLEKAFEGADTVYHVAGVVDITGKKDKLVWAVNYEGTKKVVEACRKCGVKNLVVVSSVDCVPPTTGNDVIRELNHYDPDLLADAYGKSKAASTQYCIEQSDDSLKICIVQPSCCIGPDDIYGTNSVCTMIDLYLNGLFPVTLGFGGYNFVDVRDVARGMIAAAEKGKGGETYFLVGEKLTVNEFIATMAKIEGKKAPKIALGKELLLKLCPVIKTFFLAAGLPPVLTPFSINKICENCNFSYEKAAADLGYQPMTAEESLRDTINWMKANGRANTSIKVLAKNIGATIKAELAAEKIKEKIENRKWKY